MRRRFDLIPPQLTGASSRRTVLRRAGGAVTASAILAGARFRGIGAAAQEEAEGESPLGVTPPGQTAIEFVGKIEQRGFEFTAFCYLTYLAGIDAALLFGDVDPFERSEATARFGFFATATATARSVIDNLFAIDAEGELTFYQNDPGSLSFDDPASFAAGTAIGICTTRFQNVINVQSPQQGIATGVGDVVLRSAELFVLGTGGSEVQFGEVDLRYRFSFTGQGTLLEPDPVRADILVVGNATVAPGQERR